MKQTQAWPFPSNTKTFFNDFGNTLEESRKSFLLELDTVTEKDPSGRALSEPGTKADQGKDLPWLFQTGFANALAEVVKVTTLGARKYTPNGWASVPNGQERYMEGFARHMQKLASGEVFDNGPGGIGTYHISQAIWNLLAAFELELRAKK